MSVEKTRRSSWFVSLLTLLVILQTATPAWAWGRLGHRVIARLAEKHMTPEAKSAVVALLESGESLADASLWADENRGRLPKTAPSHCVEVPLRRIAAPETSALSGSAAAVLRFRVAAAPSAGW
ncbi:MAG: S1/P1 nuclease [Isosphaeraceae bacterium]